MTRDEAKEFLRTTDIVIVRAWATATPGNEDVTEARFPGCTYSGYILATPGDVLGWADWLDFTKIEEW